MTEASLTPAQPIALFVDDSGADQPWDTGTAILRSHMQAIRSLGYRPVFVPSRTTLTAQAKARLAAEGVWTETAFSCPEHALKFLGAEIDIVYLHRLDNAERYAALTRTHAPAATLICSLPELPSLRLRRQALAQNRPELDRTATALEVREGMCAWMADLIVTPSEIIADVIRRTVPTAHVQLTPWNIPVHRRKSRTSTRPDITFIGHFPDQKAIDAARWLVTDILPLLTQLVPHILCRIMGQSLPASLTALESENVLMQDAPSDGPFPETDLLIAPYRFSAGIEGTVLQAWGAGVPVIVTPLAVEGLVDVTQSPWHAATAHNAADFAQKIAHFLKTPSAGRAQISAARKIIRASFTQASVEAALAAVLAPTGLPDAPQTSDDQSYPLN